MNDWLVALIGVGGTLAGTVAGGSISALTDRARWRREQQARWADDRRAAYSKVITECEFVVNEVTFGRSLEGRTFRDIADDLRPVQERLRPLVLDLELIGTEGDGRAARDLLYEAEILMGAAIRNPEAPAGPHFQRWMDALGAFEQRARAGLHLDAR